MRKSAWPILCALMLSFVVGEAVAGNLIVPRRLRIPEMTVGQKNLADFPPIIDRFRAPGKAEVVANTKVTMAISPETLYLRFDCVEPADDKIIAKTDTHDGAVWTDDCVELDIDARNAKNLFFQIIVNANGVVYDAIRSPMDYEDASWTSRAKVDIKRRSNMWSVFLRIPLSALKINRAEMSVIGMNFVRRRYAGLKEMSAYRPIFLHTWFPRGFVADSAAFQEFVISARPGKRSKPPLHPYGKGQYPPMRVYSTKGEFDKSAMSRAAQMDYAAVAWPFFQRRNVERSGALKFGLAYDYNKRLKVMKTTGILPMMTLDKPAARENGDLDVWATQMRKISLKCVFTPFMQTEVKRLGLCPPDKFTRAFLPDARLKNAYVDQVERAFRYYKDIIAVFFIGDEFYKGIHDAGLWLWWNKRKEYKFIQLVDAQVRENFGFGKYGMPKDPKDINPYRLIAYKRWVLDWCNRFEGKICVKVRELSPGVLTMSDDHVSGIPVHDIGRWRYNFDIAAGQVYGKPSAEDLNWGWLPKFYADVSGTPQVWNCIHMEHYPASYTPGEVRQILSEYFRAGGTGLVWFDVDVRGNGRLAMEEYYGAPDRWRYVAKIIKLWRKGLRPRKPRPRVGVLFSNPSQMARYDGRIKSAYGLLARQTGVYFKYFDDGNLRRGQINPNDFDIILVPYARYERFDTGEKILDAAKAGTTVVVCDPNAFSYDLDGSDLKLLRNRMCGDFTIGESIGAGSVALNSINAKARAGKRFKLKIPAGAKITATLPDGSPAAFEVGAGKGSIIWFAANPLTYYRDKSWEAWWRNLFARKNISTDIDYWRITLPEPTEIRESNLVCLTGNAVRWRSSRPELHMNIEAPGTYSYSIAPDLTEDQGGKSGDILFSRGDLCDRFDAPSKRERFNNFFVSWKSQEEVAVDFDLSRPLDVKEVAFFATGSVPSAKIFTGASLKTLKEAAQIKGPMKTDMVVALRTKIAGKEPVRYVRIVFAKRPGDTPFTLATVSEG